MVHNLVYIGLGSNIGDSDANIEEAIEQIKQLNVSVTGTSSFYRSKSWGFESDYAFSNVVIALDTSMDIIWLFNSLQQIEKNMGRVKTKTKGYEDRIIDIDILDFKGIVFKNRQLEVPHALMHHRNFVLEPLAEICPDWRHPVTNKDIDDLIKCLN